MEFPAQIIKERLIKTARMQDNNNVHKVHLTPINTSIQKNNSVSFGTQRAWRGDSGLHYFQINDSSLLNWQRYSTDYCIAVYKL